MLKQHCAWNLVPVWTCTRSHLWTDVKLLCEWRKTMFLIDIWDTTTMSPPYEYTVDHNDVHSRLHNCYKVRWDWNPTHTDLDVTLNNICMIYVHCAIRALIFTEYKRVPGVLTLRLKNHSSTDRNTMPESSTDYPSVFLYAQRFPSYRSIFQSKEPIGKLSYLNDVL